MPESPHVALTLTQFWHRVPGGTATSIASLATALGEAQHARLTGIGPRGELRNPRSLLDPAAGANPVTGVDMVYLGAPLPLLYDLWDRWQRPSIDPLGDFDLIHLTVPVTPPRTRLPLVATVHDVFPLTNAELFTSRGAKLMARGLERIRDRADKVLVWTRAVADECVRAGFDAARLEVAPAGVVPVELGPDDVAAVMAKYGLTAPYLFFVGTLEPRKNLALVLEALVRLDEPGLSLVLAGPTGWEASSGEGPWARWEDVPSPVVHLGYVPREDLAALQRGAAAFCFPSLMEGFGLPVLEAMAAGALVITSGVSATAEVAGDAALLVDPHSPTEMVAALRTALEDGAAGEQLRSAALERARRFTWSACAATVAEVYRTVAP